MFRKLLAIFITLFLSACSNDSEVYFPLEPGTQWSYIVRSTTMDGTETKKFIVQTTHPREWNDETRFVRTTLAGTWLFYDRNEQGIYNVAIERQDQAAPYAVPENQRTVLKYPLQAGTSWSEMTETAALYRTGPPQRSEYWIHAPVRLNYVIEAIDDSVKVPAGRFNNCLRVHAEGQTPNYDAGNYVGRTNIIIKKTDWYAPGVGLVKSVREETTTSKVLNHGSMQTFAGKLIYELEAVRDN